MRALVFTAALAAGCAPHDDPAPTSATTPRVISLSPSATEIVAALGATADLVGVDSYSAYPAEVKALPKTGDYLHPNLEAIVALRPTLVIADDVHAAAADALRDQRVHTVTCPIHALPDVEACLTVVGAELGMPAKAAAVVAGMEAAVAAARAHPASPRPRVLAVLDRDPGDLGNLVAAGPGSYVDELLAVLGADNALAASPAPYPKVSTEELLRAAPDVVLDLSFPAHTSLDAWQGLDVPAVHAHRVVAVTDETAVAPSPRVGQALAAIAQAIR